MPRTTAWAVVGLCCLLCLPSCVRPPSDTETSDLAYPIGDFSLTERDGREVHASDLAGKVWIASFIFTRCTGPCPQVVATMQQLQTDYAAEQDVRLVTFTVDPEFDTPEVLRNYAEQRAHADPQRWLFLTGKEAEIHHLLREGFHIGAEKNTAADATPADAVTHNTHLAVVDRQGRVRGYYAGKVSLDSGDPISDFEKDQKELHRKVAELLGKDNRTEVFPAVNAALNALAGLLLLVGYAAIRRRLVQFHVVCMTAALAVSTVFLASYLYFHLIVMHGQPTYFHEKWPGAPHWVVILYLAILATHTILAAVTAPLALFTAFLGLRNNLARHVWIARWTLPIWLYVSITGVVVYWMLYRLY